MKRLNVISMGVFLLISVFGLCSASEGTWTRKADMPAARSTLCASVVDGKIYAIGGGPAQDVVTKSVERYDPETDSWATKSSMQTPRAFFGTAAVNGRVYAVGGYSSGGARLASVEEYNPATDTWRPRADMPTKRAWLCVSALNGKIYGIGGLPTTEVTGTVEAYDPVTDTWMPKADMPTQRGGAVAASVDGKIYVIGGAVGNLHTPPLSIVEAYDPITDTWTRKADMPTARMALAVSVVGGRIYAIGGYDFFGPIYATVEVYDPATDTWTNMPDMQFPRKALASAAVNGKIYAIGGQPVAGWNAPISVVEEYDLNPSPDFNGDGLVNIEDLLRLIQSWDQDDPVVDLAPPPYGDGIIEAQDLEVLMRDWGQDDTFMVHWKLDETGGEIAYDSVGESHGTAMGNPTWQREGGQIDGALEFDGIDDYVTAPFILDPTRQPFSVFAWIQGGAPGQVIISQKNGIGSGEWLSIDSTGALASNLTYPLSALASNVVVTDDQWHRIGVVSDGLGMSLYVDDMEVARSDTPPILPVDGGLQIGVGENLEPDTFFSGLVDDVRIYSRAVTP